MSPKFNFVPERQLNEPTGNGFWTVSVLNGTSTKTIYFPKDMVEALELDGKFLQIFADVEKKAIGWRVIEDKTTLDTVNNARKVNKNKATGALVVSIGKVIKALNYDLKESVRGLVVQTYTSPLIKDPISYVVLPPIECPKE